MRVPVEWLKEHVAIRLAPSALAQRLTMAGLEVTGVEDGAHGAVLDLEITPNRPDCLSIIGVAREVAVATGQRLKLPVPPAAGRAPSAGALGITIEDRAGCSRYIGRLIDGVAIRPSPEWMQRRLLACGIRPINTLVDVTNYVLLEYGQPLHAFDYDRLAGGVIIVRRAREGEPITTLDGVSRKLSAEALVIADAARPVAVAGVMGGMGSEVTASTKRVLLESARFDPLRVRRTARQLGLASESSYRFERGVDPGGVDAASVRASGLIRELAGGREVAARDAGRAAPARPAIALSLARASAWLGTRIDPPAARATFARLGCRVASGDAAMRVIPPSYRQDLTQDVDLYEELARVAGYDRLPARIPTAPLGGTDDPSVTRYQRLQSVRDQCVRVGLTEAITWSLRAEEELRRHGFDPAQAAKVANPLSHDHAVIRPSLLPGLLQAVRRNVGQGTTDVRLFELGSVATVRPGAPLSETAQLGVILTGAWLRDWREQPPGDFTRLAGVVRRVLASFSDGDARFVPRDLPWSERGQSAAIELGGRVLGVLGQVARAQVAALDVDQDVWYGEVDVERLLERPARTAVGRAPAALPPVKRDLSILIPQATTYDAVERAIREAGGALAAEVELIDRYTGKQVPPGQVSLTFAIAYRHPDRTLTAAEADEAHGRIGRTLRDRFGATLR